MKRIALAFAFAVLATTSALAADNSVIVTPGTGVTLRSKDVGGGIESLMQILGDVSGNPLPTAPGTSNASFALPIQGVTGGIAVPISGLVTANPGTAANWGIGATGSAVPANAVYMGIISGGNLTGWTGAVTQGTAANLNATVVGTGTFAVQATLQASAGTAIGKVDPNTLATWGLTPLGGTTSSPTNALLGGCQYSSSAPTFTTGDSGAVQCTINGYPIVSVNNTATQVTPGNGISAPTGTPPSTSSPVTSFNEMYNGSTWDALQDDANKNLKVAPQASPVGGALSSTWLASAASNNATNVKNAAGTLYTVTVTQSTTTAMELKLYNTSSSPTCSSATGLVDIIPIPSNAISPGYHLPYPVGRAFSTGISFCLVAFGGLPLAQTTATP